MKYTAAQLRLLSETKWGWAVRGDKSPPKRDVAARRETPAEREARANKSVESYLKAQRRSDWVERLLDQQHKANAQRRNAQARARGEVPSSSETETWIINPEE